MITIYYCNFFFPIISTKNSGINNMAINVDPSIPPTIPVPTECCAFEFAPVANTSGNAPKTNANDVMIIGRNRCFAANNTASTTFIPARKCSIANSVIKIEFFADKPNNVIKLIWKYKSLSRPRKSSIAPAAHNANGIAKITTNGKRHISNCAANTKKIIITPNTNANIELALDDCC